MVAANQPAKLKIFISYSRTDEVFSDELRFGLEDRGYAVEMDKSSIRQGEEWKARLSRLIVMSDTVVFVLSPDSSRSPICHWEVEQAHTQGKRIIPVLHRGLHERPMGKQPNGDPWPQGPAVAPQRLTLINYPRFDEGRSFQLGLRGLAQALEDDLEWIEAHSRLALRATDWDEGGRSTNRLMLGADIEAAKRLVETRKSTAPPFLSVQLDFIKASEDYEASQQNDRERSLEERRKFAEDALVQSRRIVHRTRIGLILASTLALVAVAATWFVWNANMEVELQRAAALDQANVAKSERQRAIDSARRAEEQAKVAKSEQRRAEQALAVAAGAWPYLIAYTQKVDTIDPEGPEAQQMAKALTSLAQYVLVGIPSIGLAADRRRAIEYLKSAAIFFNSADAAFMLAQVYIDTRPNDENSLGIGLLTTLSRDGDRRGDAALGNELVKGEIIQRDFVKGLALLIRAKEKSEREDEWTREVTDRWIKEAFDAAFANASEQEIVAARLMAKGDQNVIDASKQ